jgi:hypothetical protein
MTFKVITHIFTYLIDLIASAMGDVGGGGQMKLTEVSKLVSSL